MLAVFLWFVAAVLTFSSGRAAGSAFAAALVQTAITIGAFGRLKALTKERDDYLQRLDGKPIEEALTIARRDSTSLPPGLVAHKVRISLPRWHAFERGAFQFVIAADSEGRAHTFSI
jgi:hypothetical protein